MPDYGAPVPHKGGIIGETSFPTRMVSPSVFANAPRFHLGSNEVPIIAEKGEKIIPKDQVSRGSGVTNIYFNVTTPNADSFRRSKTQIANDLKKVAR